MPSYEGDEPLDDEFLNTEQTLALVKIKDWFEDNVNKVFSLSGAFYTGKSKVIRAVVAEIVQGGMSPIYLAPNARIANRYKSSPDFS